MLLSFLEPGVLWDNWGGLAYGLLKLFLCFKKPVVVLVFFDGWWSDRLGFCWSTNSPWNIIIQTKMHNFNGLCTMHVRYNVSISFSSRGRVGGGKHLPSSLCSRPLPPTVFSPAIFVLTILKTDTKTATTTRLPYISDLTVLFLSGCSRIIGYYYYSVVPKRSQSAS